ncbi:uncharacterized protein LOC132748066 isoform X3 [Ruditapes philippinarum]|uniref:uncharacterized protein LOC132748066 isoform X3 n=1 Tax=Ruditapes philippinarum TaxID=129788 RepID=UPI00295BF8F8|nr:uncharacterized protein LOC132748066 isoform X3 [Ruditapes philippinarum]
MDVQFENFMLFCEGYLDDSNKKLLTLAKKRYHECEVEYKRSQELCEYILCTEAKILKEESRFYVHLRDFLSILKENKARDGSIESNLEGGISKRIHESSESESDVAFAAKRRKIDKFDNNTNNLKTEDSEEENSDQNYGRPGFITGCEILSNSAALQKEEDGLQPDDSDQEMEKSPDSVENDEDDVENEIWESELVTAGEKSESDSSIDNKSDMDDSESEDHEMAFNRKEEFDSNNVSDSDEIESNEMNGDINAYQGILPDLEDFPAAEIISKAEVSHTKKTKDDNLNDMGTNLTCSSKNKKHVQGNKDVCDSQDEIEDSIDQDEIEDSIDDEKNSVIKGPTDILNISSEKEEKADKEELKKQLISSENCSEIESCIDQDSRNEKWSDDGVCVIESDTKPLCLTIKRVKGAKGDEDIVENPGLNHGSGNTIKNKYEKTEEGSKNEFDGDGFQSNNNVKDTGETTLKKNTNYLSDEIESESDDDDHEDKVKVLKDFSKTSLKKDSDLSTNDEEDQFDSLKAKKFREKCKKKYVVSVGKKKHKTFTSPSKDHSKFDFLHKIEKEKSPRKKHTPNNSPKCNKKFSPNKSPIIIFTDSESDDDIGDIEGFKKKFNEKVKRQIQFQENSPLKPKKSPVKKAQKMEIDNDVDSEEDMCHSGKENHRFTKIADKEHMAATHDDRERKEKKRVNLITEEYYNSKSDNAFKHHKNDKSYDFEDNEGKDKKTHKSEDKSPKEKNKQVDRDKEQYKNGEKSSKQAVSEGEDVHAGPSSTSDTDNALKKGSSRQIRKLEALLESIRNQIEKVRLRELDLEDLDSDVSDYLLEDKLQRKFMKVWDKLCELHKAVKNTGRPTDKYFRYQGTRYPDIDRKLEKFINKKKVFPDYHDVRGIIMKVNREKKLHLRSREIDDLSREAFTDIGNQLQKRRTKDFVSTFLPHGSHTESLGLLDDPALLDIELKKKLDANRKSAKSNMDKVMEKYASLQYQVGDKTEEESEEEEEEEEEEAANIDVDLDQLSGVDNTDSDKDIGDNDKDIVDAGDKSRDKSWESGPCLEIGRTSSPKPENLESGQKSTFSYDNPEDVKKLSPMKPAYRRDVVNKDNKERHFCEQLGLYRTSEKEEVKDIEQNPTVIEEDIKSTEPALPPPRPVLPPPREMHQPSTEPHQLPSEQCHPPSVPHPSSSETKCPQKDDFESIGHCSPSLNEGTVDEAETVMILSDNEEDDVLICSQEPEKENKIDTNNDKFGDISKENQDVSVSNKDANVSLTETSLIVSASSMVSTSPKISVNVSESSQVFDSNAKDNNEVIKSEEDEKNTSDISNVTIITDDEDEDKNVSDDQSLGLKIVSAHHVSLSDISKLHGEEDENVDNGIVSGKNTSEENTSSLNSSSESVKQSVKLPSEVEKEIDKESSQILPVLKDNEGIKKPSNNIDNKIIEKINEVLNSEPDVMIIDDVENEVLPVCPTIQKRNVARKIDNISGSLQRNNSNFTKVNRVKNSNVQGPNGLHSRTDFTVQNRGRNYQSPPPRNNTTKPSNMQSFAKQQSSNSSNMNTLSMKGGTKMSSPLSSNSNIISPSSYTDWHSQPQKSPANFNKGNTGSKCVQQYPRNLNNTNRFMGGNTKLNTVVSSNSRCTSNNSWKVQQNEFEKNNSGISKVMTPMNMNSKMKFTSNSPLKVQQQKFGRDTSGPSYTSQYTQGFKQMNTGSKMNPRSSFRMQSNTYQPYPYTNKNWNAQSPKHSNFVQRNYNIPQSSPRFTAVPFKGGSSSGSTPARTNSSQFKHVSNKGFNIQGQTTQRFSQKRSTGFQNSQQKFPNTPNQVRKVSNERAKAQQASFTASKVIDDVVIIDCDEVDQVPVKKKKTSKHKEKCAVKYDTANDVICIDDPPECGNTSKDAIYIVSENIKNTEKERTNTIEVTKTESKCAQNSSISPQCSKLGETSKKNHLEGSLSTENSTSNSKLVKSKTKIEETSVKSNKNKDCELEICESGNKEKMHLEVSSVEFNQESHLKEKPRDVERTSSNELEQNVAEDEELRSIPDIFEGSLGTVESNECESIESFHGSESCDKKPEDLDELQKEESNEYDMEEAEPTEIFTAIKLDSVKLNDTLGSTGVVTVENKPSTCTQGLDVSNDEENAACQDEGYENLRNVNDKQSALERNSKSTITNIETGTELVSDTSVQANDQHVGDDDDDLQASDDEGDDEDDDDESGDDDDNEDDDEVSCGIENDDSISSTSCDVDSHANVKIVPDIRNKLIQLEKAIVKSKPEQEIRSQAKPQDIVPRPPRNSGRAQWIEEDENASLIETYQEPDSTPYSLEVNQISSSSSENIIVLSDSE